MFFTCQKVVRSAEKVIKGDKVRNICQKVVQLAEKGEKADKVKKGENKLKKNWLIYIYGLILHYNLLKLTRYFKKVKTLSSDLFS